MLGGHSPGHSKWALGIAGVVVFTFGLLVRLVDLTDPPLDFNPTRQLRSAIIARGMYYGSQPEDDALHRQLALTHWKMMERLEPPLLEWVVASTYRLIGGEQVWAARIYTIFFWLIGGAALHDLARRMASPLGALVGVGYFFFLPFSILASRSFQPDPGMIMLILLTGWSLWRWAEKRTWRWALLAGVFGGAAAFVKAMGIFFVGGMAAGVVLYNLGLDAQASLITDSKWQVRNLKFGLRDLQVWVMAGLMVTPALLYAVLGADEQSSPQILHWTVLSRWQDVLSLSFYMRWMIRVSSLMGPGVVLASFIGALLIPPKSRALLWGFWIGYGLYGLTFPYHIATHDYYHLPLLAVVSLSLAVLAGFIAEKVWEQGRLTRVLFIVVALIAAIYNGWIGRSILVGQDFSQHPAYWQEIGDSFPADAKAVGVTQDYGFRLMYYGWRTIKLWPSGAGSENFEEQVGEADYFVVTALNQLDSDLKEYLAAQYPIYAEGIGYIIYHLRP
ncbi:MAG: glycosyltransferase family 39 protein [Chloroflexi bacterium]|nr:glycosyltransferase family 39 protein [Chloroflexota bacterium]